MSIVKIRPEHVPHVLRMFDVEQGFRKQLIKLEYSGYSRDVLLANLELFRKDNIFEIVPSIDDLCEDCPKQGNCEETDATLFAPFNEHLKRLGPDERSEFLMRSLDYICKDHPYLAEAFPFTHLIGNRYNLEQLYHIRKNPNMVLKNI